MNTIYKYSINWEEYQLILVPKSAKPLSMAVQNGQLCLWMTTDSLEEIKRGLEVVIVGTGQILSERTNHMRFMGTFIVDSYVWHVWVH